MDYVINSSFQGVNRLLLLSFEDNAVRKGHGIFTSKKLKNKRLQYHDWYKKLFDQTVRKNIKIYENVTKIPSG